MLLKDVLGLFSKDINEMVVAIEYGGSPNDFCVKIEYEGYFANVHLYSDGTASFELVEPKYSYIPAKLISAYSWMRMDWEVWKCL